MDKLTFKQYLESKERLREAANSVPQQTATYDVRKYCKLVVGESKEEKEYIKLKPKNKIIVEWKYDDVDNPTCMSICFEGTEVSQDQRFSALWAGDRLVRWLDRNAKQIP